MIRSAILPLALGVACAAHAAPNVGDTLACTSSNPAKRLFVVVGRIEPFGQGKTAAQITLISETSGTLLPRAAHIPIDLEALRASCPTLADQPRTLDANFESGRQQWLHARGGIFTITVDQIDDILQNQVASARSGADGSARP